MQPRRGDGPVGIKQVAAAAGVSITTVSHALNDKGRVTPETRNRVREVARRLGYHPSASARSLGGGRAGILACTVSEVEPLSMTHIDYFVELTNSASATALDQGYSLMLVPATVSEQVWSSVPLDGAIIVDPAWGDPTVAELRERGTLLVTTGRQSPDNRDEYWVDNDHVAGVRAMLDHIAEQGAERIALVTSPPVSSYTADSMAGYEGWCAERGMKPRIATVTDTLTESGGYGATMRLLDGPEPPDAIYAAHNRLGLGVLLAAEACQIEVPGQLLVAACADSRASQNSRPALTALGLDPARIGREAVELLIALVEDRTIEHAHRYVPAAVQPRASTDRRLVAN
jgi:DNA-binding LacI/PurR family transcriptional regulator